MIAAIFAASALGFAAPKSNVPAKPKLLALRGGGISTDVLLNSQVGLIALTGLQGWLAPVSTLKMYGKKDPSPAESTFTRVVSGANIMAAAVMIAAKTSLEAAVVTAAIAWALAIVPNVALFEQFEVPKPPLVGFVAIMLGIGGAAATGLLPAGIAFNIVVPLFLIAISIYEIVAQDQNLAMYKMPEGCKPMVKSLMFNFDMTKLAIGAFLVALKVTGKLDLALAAMSATSLLNVVVTALKTSLPIDKAGLIFWAVIQSAIGGLALMNGM